MKLVKHILTCVALTLFAVAAWAAGAVTSTVTGVGGSTVKYTLAWTSDASGDVSGNTLTVGRGYILQVQFDPGSGGTQPTNLYDVKLNNDDTVDYLMAVGADRSNVTSSVVVFTYPVYFDGTESLDLVVANAGNAKTGVVTLWTRPRGE